MMNIELKPGDPRRGENNLPYFLMDHPLYKDGKSVTTEVSAKKFRSLQRRCAMSLLSTETATNPHNEKMDDVMYQNNTTTRGHTGPPEYNYAKNEPYCKNDCRPVLFRTIVPFSMHDDNEGSICPARNHSETESNPLRQSMLNTTPHRSIGTSNSPLLSARNEQDLSGMLETVSSTSVLGRQVIINYSNSRERAFYDNNNRSYVVSPSEQPSSSPPPLPLSVRNLLTGTGDTGAGSLSTTSILGVDDEEKEDASPGG